MEWWEKYFGKDYLILYPPESQSETISDNIDFIIRELNIPKGGRILDLCCGYGRHSLLFAKYGYQVVGYDLSNDLLEYAKSRNNGPGIIYQQGDMRSLPYRNEFHGIVNLSTSLGFFKNDAENELVIQQVANALRPGGRFLLDHWNPEKVHFPGSIKNWRENPEGNDVILEIYERDLLRNRLRAKKILHHEGERREYYFDVRIYSPAELTSILSRHGLHVLNIYGNFRNEPLTSTSARMVFVALKE